LLSNELLSLNFNSDGSNSLKNTNNLKTVINNNFDFKSIDYFSDKGFKNNIGFYFKNVNTVAKNDTKYKSSPQLELMNIINLESTFPLVKEDKKYFNSVTPKISLRLNPTDMKNHSDSDRLIDNSNIFSINRLSISDSYESGKSVTLGIDYKKEKIENINRFFELNLATVLRDVKQDRIPIKSTLGEKQSNLFGSMSHNMSKMINLNYDFALDNDLQTFEYNSIGTEFDFNKLVTNFEFVETGGKMGDTNFIKNSTQFKFNEDNLLTFSTRRNRKISLTEYYDLVYEYKNDCLVAGLRYKKTYYQDRDLLPTEDLLFSITLFPLTKYESKVNQDLYRN
jgi:LPS-assembly protein